MLGEMAITSLPKLPKLIESLQRKEGYVLHYLTLQLYVQSGVKVTHFHRVLQFRQAKWISPFVELNTELRKAAKNRFQEKFYKVIVNSAFGRTMESKRNRRKLSIIRNENETMQKLCNSSLKCFQITDEDLAFRPTSIRWDKPTIVGAVILDLAKAFTFNYHHTQMKPKLNLELLYSDTNSFIYVVKTNDVYEDLKKMSEHSDFSNFPKTSSLYSHLNRRKVWNWKDELGGKIIKEFLD